MLWQLCEQKCIFIYAPYIKLKEWELDPYLFRSIATKIGKPSIDLFVSRLNKKCAKYLSWKRDPDVYDMDAFTVP